MKDAELQQFDRWEGRFRVDHFDLARFELPGQFLPYPRPEAYRRLRKYQTGARSRRLAAAADISGGREYKAMKGFSGKPPGFYDKRPGRTVKPDKQSEPKMSKGSFAGSIGLGGSGAINRRSLDINNGVDQARPNPESGPKGNRPVAGGPSGYGPRKTGQVTKPGEADAIARNGPSQQPMVNSFSDTSVGQGAKSRG